MGEDDARPIGALMHSILKLLQTELRPLSSAEIQSHIGVDVLNHPAMLENLKANPKILREPDGRWRWKSKYYLRNSDDLLALLRRSTEPIVASELYDAYKGIKADIESLLNEAPRQVIAIKNASSGKTLLMNYEPRLFIQVSEDIITKWNEIRVPDANDTHRFLVQHGLKSGSALLQASGNMFIRKRPKRQDQKKSKRVKLTNVHMEGTGIDLTKDLDLKNGKPSAFQN